MVAQNSMKKMISEIKLGVCTLRYRVGEGYTIMFSSSTLYIANVMSRPLKSKSSSSVGVSPFFGTEHITQQTFYNKTIVFSSKNYIEINF